MAASVLNSPKAIEMSILVVRTFVKLKGLLGLCDPLLGLTFNQIGDRAAAGLVETLAGERVAE